jgi:hypothetical protein
MTNDEYIESVLARHELKPGFFAYFAKGIIIPELEKWANGNINRIVYTGSMAKGTGVAGTTDLDIFISLKTTTPHTLEDIYERLFRWSETANWIPRRQNVSIGLTYLGVKIDLVPGKLQEGYIYYHSLWKNKEQTWTQSAPEIHVDKVIESGRTREIRAIKVWRKIHGLEFPSFYLELAVMRALSGCGTGLASNVQRVLGWIADNLETAAIEDPANTNNMISDDLTQAEKKIVAVQAQKSFNEQYWIHTIW